MKIKVMGHRGCRYRNQQDRHPDAPYENSYDALEFALKHSMGLETDIILSKQKTPYLTHDTLFSDRVYYELKIHLDQLSKEIVGDRFIYQIGDDEIAKFKYLDGQSFTRLDKFFEIAARYPKRILNFELKGPHVNDVVVEAVEKAIADGLIARDQVIFSSFNLPAMHQLRQKYSDKYKIGVILAMNWQNKTIMFPDWPEAPQDAFYTPFKLEENILQNPDIVAARPDFFHIEYKTLTDEGLAAIHAFDPNARITLWPFNEPHPDSGEWYLPDIIQHFSASGKLYGAMTDFPDRLQKELEKRDLAEILPQ